MERNVVLAVGAHPDDIEFAMAGTLLLLKEAGAEIHMWPLANGYLGTVRYSRDEIIRIRGEEARRAAERARAIYHAPLFEDLAIFYDAPSLARVAAVVREVGPTLLLTHPPFDYMEDHQNTCRLVVSAAFVRGMPNFVTSPPRPSVDTPVALYHCLPAGGTDSLRRPMPVDYYVDIGPVLLRKRELLAEHRSQKEWLDISQGMDSYLDEMVHRARAVGQQSGQFEYAEAWRRHLHLGLSPADYDPLKDLLKGGCYAASPE